MPAQTTTPLVDLPATAHRLGVNHRYVRRLVAERRIPFIKFGHLIRFDPAEVDAWLDGAPGRLTARYHCSRVAGPLLAVPSTLATG